ncbi:MAG: glycosyltransferase [Lachnospiraceae bacterium]|nr:glycosyltransferase [Lachnospiraceae bacterium]
MKLSIIVPVYNMASDGKLEFCLDSLLNQTLEDYEVIAINDASTDNSLEILQQYQKKYPEKLVVDSLKENHRQGGAKNLGLSLSRGDFIGFVDSDDWVTLNCFERLLDKAKETGADVVACDFCYVYEHTMNPTDRVPCNLSEQVGELTHERKASLFMNPGALVTKIYQRNLLFDEPFAFPEHMFFEDNATGIELLRRAKHFEYIPEPMYFYYQHNASTVHVITMERCNDRLEAMRIMYKYASEKGYLEEFYDEIEYKFTNLFYQNTLFSYMQGTPKTDMGFVRRMGKEMRTVFPDFQKNKYYVELVHSEEKKLMKMQQKSTVWFVLYYRALNAYRKFRKNLEKSS